MPLIATRVAALIVFALFGLLTAFLISPIRGQDPPLEPVISDAAAPLGGPQYPVEGRIVWRLREDGRLELCLRNERGERVCPRSRFVNPMTLRQDQWISSSEVSWDVPFVPELVEQPSRLDVSAVVERETCTPDFERMMASTWRVETAKWSGSAFHIGNGRFLTAHHVIDGVPPFVDLRFGHRGMVAAVLDSDPSVDMALLEVYDKSLVADVPVAPLRIPEQRDLGEPVYLVGYPGGGELTVSFGGVIFNIWNDEIQTTSASRGGNSGGPMFDACGNVLGVLWAGNAATNFSHSGEALLNALDRLEPRWPALPRDLAHDIRVPKGMLIWHFGTQPPEEIDCSSVDADFWVGVAGLPRASDGYQLWSGDEIQGKACSYRAVRVVGFERPEDYRGSWTPEVCVQTWVSALNQNSLDPATVHISEEEFGTVRLLELDVSLDCPSEDTHMVLIERNDDTPAHVHFNLDGDDGRRLPSAGDRRGHYSVGNVHYRGFALPPGVSPTTIGVKINNTWWRINVHQLPTEQESISVQARIGLRVESESGSAFACLQPSNHERTCTTGQRIPYERAETDQWYRLPNVNWRIDALGHADAAWLAVRKMIGYSCAVTPTIGESSWQVSALTHIGTAVYVGRGQFLTDLSSFNEDLPWAVISRAEVALPAMLVAADRRNGLALLEAVGDLPANAYGSPVSFASAEGPVAGTSAFLISYPWGEAERYNMTLGTLSELTDRQFDFSAAWSYQREGAPVVDPCSHEVLGQNAGRGTVLRSDVVAASLTQLRRNAKVARLPSTGPPLYGSAALRQYPLYVGTNQPNFGGWICNVRSSERYDVIYAIYLANTDHADRVAVIDGERSRISSCGYSSKVFMVEYRSDKVPDAICIEPRRPNTPLSTLEIEFEAPEGVRLLQATDFPRAACPGADPEINRWNPWHSDVYFKLRVTADIALGDIVVSYFDADDQELAVNRYSDWDVDPDVIAWRAALPEDSTLARIVVSLAGQEPDP